MTRSTCPSLGKIAWALLAGACLLLPGALSAQSREGVNFEIPVLPDAIRYADLLAAPGVAALALQNNGLRTSVSSRLIVPSRESFQIRLGELRFTGKKASVYRYEARLTLESVVGQSTLSFPVEADAARVPQGVLTVRVHPPLARFVPAEVIERIEFKIRSIADLESQRQLLSYLDRLALENKIEGRAQEKLLEVIVLDGYNRSSGAVQASGGLGDSLSDQLILLSVLGLWLIGFPLFLLFARRKRKSARANPSPQ